MVRFSKIFLAVTVVLILAWQLPWCYNFLTARSPSVPFTLYSGVAGDFISIGRMADDKNVTRTDREGHIYTQEETDSLLPFFYIRQLMTDERFPDSIQGVEVTPREVQTTNFTFRASASDINANRAELYPLLESMSGRVELTMPDDVFRITSNGIEFIDMKTNSVDAGKSRSFTQTMLNKGFCFPARRLSGNPTTRKEYDDGYLILDAEGKLFHLKQTRGRPYVRAIPLDGVKACHVFVTELRSKKIHGLLTDEENRMYVIDAQYGIYPTGVEDYNPAEDNLTIIGNMMDWTVCVRNGKAAKYYALRADDYSLIDSMQFALPYNGIPGLHFTSSYDKYVYPRI